MAKNKAVVLLIFCLAPLSSCHRSDSNKEMKLVEHDMSRATIDIELPTSLWDRIETVYKVTSSKAKEESKKEKKGESKGEVKVEGDSDDSLLLEDVSKEYVPISVRLSEKPDNKGILQAHDHQLYYGAGGGVLDLADFVENRRGSYYLKVEFAKTKTEETNEAAVKDFSKESIRVFYLSNSRRRKWGGKIVGSGCNKYYDITSFFEKSMKGNGLLLNTTDHLDVTSTAGSFFFAVQLNKTLYISQLSVKDSRFNSLQCHPMLNKVESL